MTAPACNLQPRAPCMHNVSTQSGFSLIELVVTIVVLGIALSAVSTNLFLNIGRSADPMWQSKATLLAQVYLDEALATRYDDLSPLGGGATGACNVAGPEPGENDRTQFDDVDDYNGLSESGSFLDTGVASDYSQYTIDIAITCVNAVNVAATNSKLILVTITGPSNSTLRISALKGDF